MLYTMQELFCTGKHTSFFHPSYRDRAVYQVEKTNRKSLEIRTPFTDNIMFLKLYFVPPLNF
jgi:hypothetical protein